MPSHFGPVHTFSISWEEIAGLLHDYVPKARWAVLEGGDFTKLYYLLRFKRNVLSYKLSAILAFYWSFIPAFDVFTLLISQHFAHQISPVTNFYINNALYFVGVDIYNICLFCSLSCIDIPSRKQNHRKPYFFVIRDRNMEPRHSEATEEKQNQNYVFLENLKQKI